MTCSCNARRIVLVVEDDPLVRMSALDIVEDADCGSYEAGNADEAMALLRAHAEIDLLFTDIDMPGSMNGLELAHAARRLWPDMTIFIASGHVRVDAIDMPSDGVFFPKPYASSEVASAIRSSPRHR